MAEGHLLHPRHPRHLLGSKWSARQPRERALHWEVQAYAPKQGLLTLRAVLTGAEERVPWRELRDRERWLPGWVQPDAEEPPTPEAAGE